MSKPRKRLEGAGDSVALDAERPRRGVGEGCVLPVMGAAKRARTRKIGRRRGLSARHHAMLADPDVGERELCPETAMTRPAPARAFNRA